MNTCVYINTKHKKIIKKSSTVLLIVFGGLSIILFVLCVGGGGVLNDLDFALEEIQDLEKRHLLKNPPDHISSVTKREIDLGQNSTTLKAYINKTSVAARHVEKSFFICIFLFFLAVIIRICCGRKLKHR
jgi:hypothetical protein